MRRKSVYLNSPILWLLLAAGSMFVSVQIAPLRSAPVSKSGTWLSGYGSSGPATAPAPRTFIQSGDNLQVEYRFQNFRKDDLQVVFSIKEAELETYKGRYGYAQAELDGLATWQKQELQQAYQYAVDHLQNQQQYDQAVEKVKQEYHRRVDELFSTRGLRYQQENVLVADIPGIVHRNVKNFSPIAHQLETVFTAGNYGSTDIVGSILSLVQTGLAYENIPLKQDGRITGGIYPPLVTLVEGRGDCDSKTALMASILLNWNQSRLVGVGVPNHYLLGVMQNPGKGDVFVEYEGANYVLMEPAGPGWIPPGTISDYTMDLLNSGVQVALEPLTVN
ncbi:MAG: hypothetical protein C0615_08300 [Desulfuromonas sp.]|nr:MAG: hypothetical protein C0615_08300 [Desulfuromonas sp.]